MCGPFANSSNSVGARQARPTLRLTESPPPGVGVNTIPAFPDPACEFRSCAPTPSESSRLGLSRRASARPPANRDDSLGVVAQDRNSQAWSGNAGIVYTPTPGGGL